ncbi:hypothetical protein KUW09_18320 [Mameliella alba]|nr:hypothetical protein [Antarctobacter heliothermus]MBY6146014.1 hypothetical protein [Mameliella alba]MCA0954569.1 hypothetical protein [Mameliella alba]
MAVMTLAAAALSLVTLGGSDADTPKGLVLAQANPFVTTQGIAAPQGDYMTTPEGCTYRRTQAPGQPVRWIIVVNPHHVGKTLSPRNCKAML